MRHLLSLLAMVALVSTVAVAQTTPRDAADRFAFGGPADGSYRLYDRATGALIAKTDALLAQVYALPENGLANAYVILAEGWEDGWSFSVRRVRGDTITSLLRVQGMDRRFDVQDLNADGQLDFTFYPSVDDNIDAEFGRIAQRDYVSGPAGYGEKTPLCGSPRNALARQRLAYAIEQNQRQSPPDAQASAFLKSEAERLSEPCGAN